MVSVTLRNRIIFASCSLGRGQVRDHQHHFLVKSFDVPKLHKTSSSRNFNSWRTLVRSTSGSSKDSLGVPSKSVYSSEQQDDQVVAFRKHQQGAPRISHAAEARTLVAMARNGVLSTTSVSKMAEGYPFGSVVNLAADDQGRAIIAISTLSLHTTDLQDDSKCSITVTAGGFSDLDDARVTVSGDMSPVPEAERDIVRSTFLEKHPDAFYVDFGDFSFYRMDRIVGAHLVGGFGRVAQVVQGASCRDGLPCHELCRHPRELRPGGRILHAPPPEAEFAAASSAPLAPEPVRPCCGACRPPQVPAGDYAEARPDPMAPFSKNVASHMNEDHANANRAMVRKYAGIDADDVEMLGLDRLGMNMRGSFNGTRMKIRLPFPRPAEDRKDVKALIVEMTKASAEHMS